MSVYGKHVCNLEWTTEPPTEGGWYWIRYPDGEIACVEVFYSLGNMETDSDYVLDTVTHWLGPLPVPEPPEDIDLLSAIQQTAKSIDEQSVPRKGRIIKWKE